MKLTNSQAYAIPGTLRTVGKKRGRKKKRPESVDVTGICNIVCDYYGIGRREIYERSRTERIAHPRHVACYLMRNKSKMSYTGIGRIVNLSHASVMHGVSKIEWQIENYKNLARDVKNITDRLGCGD